MTCRHRTAAALLTILIGAAAAIAQPVAVDDTYAPGSGVLFESDPGVLENDGGVTGSAVAELVSDVSYGTLVLDPEGVFTYTSDDGFFGVDSFAYRIVDGTVTSNTATVTLTVAGCKGGPTSTTTVCWVEGAFLAAVATSGYGTVAEGYESSPPWPRTADVASSVTSQGITWRSNYTFLTTSDGPARTGGWAVYSDPHGSQTGSGTCNPLVANSQCDGFIGAGPGGDTLFAAGGWVKSTTGTGKIRFLLRYATNPELELTFPLETATVIHRFFGVIETAGFEEFEVVEIEGVVTQQIYIFGDDFTIADGSPTDVVPPTVTSVDSFEGTGDGQLVDGETTTASITDLYVVFSEPVQDPGGDTEPDDVTNPANYLLVDDGGDGFATASCAGGVSGNDTAITIDTATWTSGSQLEAWLELNGGTALPPAAYRLLVCGTTSIRDWAGNPLDGDTNGVGGDDFVLDFTVEANQAPVADDQSVTTDEDTAKAITLTASDGNGDPLTYFITSYPAHGGLTGTPPDVTYTPDANYNGPDSFTFQAWDGTALSNTATVSITVTAVNDDPPVANPDAYTVDRGATLVVPAPGVLANDTDPDGDTLTAVPGTAPSHAAGFTLNSDGSFSYSHDGSSTVGDSFTYTASDGALSSLPATVSITVNPAAVTWYVATTGNDTNDCLSALTPCLTVGGAIAKAAAGDTISVAAGSYAMTSLVVDKDLSIVGAGTTTVLDGGGLGLGVGTTGGARLGFRDLAFSDTAG